MSLRQAVGRTCLATLLACTAFVSVGLTAPADSLFTIRIRPALINLSVDIDVKIGTMHLHTRWSALPDSSEK